MAQVQDPLPPARDINPDLTVEIAVILDKALSKAPAERYETASPSSLTLRLLVCPRNGGHRLKV